MASARVGCIVAGGVAGGVCVCVACVVGGVSVCATCVGVTGVCLGIYADGACLSVSGISLYKLVLLVFVFVHGPGWLYW